MVFEVRGLVLWLWSFYKLYIYIYKLNVWGFILVFRYSDLVLLCVYIFV